MPSCLPKRSSALCFSSTQTPRQADIALGTETKLAFLGSHPPAASQSMVTPRSKQWGCQAPLPRSRPSYSSTRLTLLSLGVLPVSPVSPVSRIPSLIVALEESGQLVTCSPGASCAIANHPRSAEPRAHHLPGTDSFHLFLKPPRAKSLQGSASSAPVGVTVHSDEDRLRPSGRCHQPHSQPRPALRTGQHWADQGTVDLPET